MALAQNVPAISEAEYLQLERHAEFRSEYFDGEIFAMARGTRAHSLIATNLLRGHRPPDLSRRFRHLRRATVPGRRGKHAAESDFDRRSAFRFNRGL